MEHLYAVLLVWAQAHGLHGVFAFMLVESAGVPFPTELGFITAQGMLDAHMCSYWIAFAWISAGHMVGSGISYYLGRAGDTGISKYLAHKPSVVAAHQKMQKWFERYGALTILFGRLVGQVRPWSSFIAGLARVPQWSFWLWTTIGTLAFTACAMWVTAVGYAYWQAHRQLGGPMIAIMLLIFYGLPAYKGIEHLIQRHRRKKTEEGQPDESVPQDDN